MAWSYDPALLAVGTNAPMHQVRFLIQDTTAARPLVQDEEIGWTLTQEANVYMAAAAICDRLVARAGGVASKSVGDTSITYDLKFYQALAGSLRARGMTYQTADVGGLSIGDKVARQNDPDAVPPAFTRTLQDNPGAPTPAQSVGDPLTRVP